MSGDLSLWVRIWFELNARVDALHEEDDLKVWAFERA
jgi:hypothetical protein